MLWCHIIHFQLTLIFKSEYANSRKIRNWHYEWSERVLWYFKPLIRPHELDTVYLAKSASRTAVLRVHSSFCCVKGCSPWCSHLLQGNWLPSQFELPAIGIHILLSKHSPPSPPSMCLRRCANGVWFGVLLWWISKKPNPARAAWICIVWTIKKKQHNASCDAAQTKKNRHCAMGLKFWNRWANPR
jgi:hypothetical protein